MNIIRRNEIGRWDVESASNPGEFHLVDLLNIRGNGGCSCKFFQFRCWVNWQQQEEPKKSVPYYMDNPTRCKHIEAVLISLVEAVITNMYDEHYNLKK